MASKNAPGVKEIDVIIADGHKSRCNPNVMPHYEENSLKQFEFILLPGRYT